MERMQPIDPADITGALQEVTQALKDILSAADNGEPYTPEELKKSFLDAYNTGSSMLRAIDPKSEI